MAKAIKEEKIKEEAFELDDTIEVTPLQEVVVEKKIIFE